MRPVARTDISANEVSQRKELYRNPSHKGGHRGNLPLPDHQNKNIFGVEEFRISRYAESSTISCFLFLWSSFLFPRPDVYDDRPRNDQSYWSSRREYYGRSVIILRSKEVQQLLIMYRNSILGYCHGANNDDGA